MLSKAKTEDSHIKTVSLARGSVSSPNRPPTSDPVCTPSVASSSSPSGLSTKRDGSSELLGSIGIVELLEQDNRPVMIVDLADVRNHGPGPLQALFANPSLRDCPGLLEIVTGLPTAGQPDASSQETYLQFKSWLLTASSNDDSLNQCLPVLSFAGKSWSCSTLGKRLRITTAASSDPASSSGVERNSRTRSSYGGPPVNDNVIPEEPKDYFGSISPPHSRTLPSFDNVSPTVEGKSHDLPPLGSTPLPESSSRTPDRLVVSELPQSPDAPCFDWTRLPITDIMPSHIKFARSFDWASTSLGPIDAWPPDLRQMCNLIMASPHPAAIYWGEDYVAIYNEAYVLLAGQKHPMLMGQSYRVAWAEIWAEVEDVFANARLTGEATMKDDDCLFMKRNDFLEETYFSWSIIPIVGNDGSVSGLYNPAFEKTRRKIAERRMLTLREIGERTASARDLRGFWGEVLAALALNEHDTPFVLLYSVADESDSDSSSMCSVAANANLQCTLEGTLGVPAGHVAATPIIDLKTGMEGFGPVFREVMRTHKPVLRNIGSKDLPHSMLVGLENRGFGDPCSDVVVCPIHPTTGDATLGFLVMGVNPRRPYDEDYSLFVQLLSRQLATSLASVVLFEEEIMRGQKAARQAALDRLELSEQLAARTQEAIESETKFTRMAEFAPVGMFIANAEGKITYSNDTWFDISGLSKDSTGLTEKWLNAIKEEDKQYVSEIWDGLMTQKKPMTTTFRFKTPYQDPDGTVGERWVLFSAYPEKHANGELKSVFGSFTDISKQKWAEGFQKRKMEEAVELKRQQENFIDMTSHEMRNPLSAILQCADEVSMTMTKFRDRLTIDADSDDAGATLKKERLHEMRDSVSSTLEAAQTIALCAQHQKRIVDDVLTLSKLDSQLLLVTPVEAQPLNVVQRALKMHEGELQSNGIQLKFHVHDSYKQLGIDWVRFDPSRVLQVLINLTTNAIKFTTSEKERTITVSIAASLEKPSTLKDRVVSYFPSRRSERVEAREDAEWGDGEPVYIYFAVEDTGRGLSEDEKKMLFLRFSQASPRTHVQYGGSGLGLFISRELTELQGGEIGVASEAGKGSTFGFYVKARRSNGPSTPDKEAAIAAQAHDAASIIRRENIRKSLSNKTKHILLVEDNLVNQRVLQKQLKNLGCVVHVANHGGEALDKLRASTYWLPQEGETRDAKPIPLSLILMDQEMPVMDGLTATREIRDMERAGRLVGHVPVIAVTANARIEQIQTALDAGLDDVVSKPFRIPELIPKIEELMDRYPEPDYTD